LARYFDAAAPTETLAGPNYNVAPTSDVYVVYEDGDARRLEAFHWGLVPFWAKDLSAGNRMINARAEGLASKAAFKRPFAKRRCIVPADGFYEWSALPGHRKKQPYFIHRVDGEPLAFAGLWEVWRDKSGQQGSQRAGSEQEGSQRAGSGQEGSGQEGSGAWVRSCTIVTTGANETMAPLHDRMPVLLPPSKWAEWLDPGNHDLDALGRLLVPAPPGLLTFHPVSTDVSNVRNQGEHLVEPVAVIDPDGRSTGQGNLLDDGPAIPPVLPGTAPGAQG
jgi:putative SOS response-associated peptidase YedK